MRASVASLSKKLISTFFAVTLALGLVPAVAFAVEDKPTEDETVSRPVSDIINKEVALDTVVAQAEATTSYFLAQTLETTRTVPIVSASVPLDTGTTEEVGEGDILPVSSTVVGSFEYRGITYAVEPGGESVAIVAADYKKLPEEFAEAQTIVLPSMVSNDGIDYYTVSRIADYSFANLSSQHVISSDSEKSALIEQNREAAALSREDVETAEDETVGITAITIPASITTIGDDAFTGFDTLQYVVVFEDNPLYSSYDGCLYDADQTSLLLIPEGRLGAVRIAPSVTEVDPEVFSHCPSVDTLFADPDSAAYQLLREGEYTSFSGKRIETILDEGASAYDDESSIAFSMDQISRYGANASSSWSGSTLVSVPDGFYLAGLMYLSASGAAVSKSNVQTVYLYWDRGTGGYTALKTEPYSILTQLNSRREGFRSSDVYSAKTGKVYTKGGTWYYDANYTEPITNGGYGDTSACVSKAVPLSAYWKPNGYTVSWNASKFGGVCFDGAETEKDAISTEVYIDDPLVRYPTVCAPEGLKFKGWTTDSMGKTGYVLPTTGDAAYETRDGYTYVTYPEDQTISISDDTDFYAAWAIDVDWTTTNLDGTTTTETHETVVSTKADPPTPADRGEGWTFRGWAPKGSAASGPYYKGNDKPTITADDLDGFEAVWGVKVSWKIDQSSGTADGTTAFTSPEGASGAEYVQNDVLYGTAPLDAWPTISARKGYDFDGWTVASGEVEADGDGVPKVKGPVTFTTAWTPKTSKVTFDASISDHGSIAVDSFATYDAALPALPSGASTDGIEGNDFTGYYDESGKKYYEADGSPVADLTWDKEGDVTLYAKLEANAYEVSFDAAPGTGGQSESVHATFGQAMPSIDTTAPIRTGYSFQGWYDGVDYEKATQYYTAAGASARSWNKAGAATLYAGWKADEYALAFDAGEGATGGQTDTVTATFDLPLPDEITKTPPKRPGYSFCGWYDAKEGGTCFYGKDGSPTDNAWTTPSNGTLYARWSLDEHDITLSPRAPVGETVNDVTKDGEPVYSVPLIEGVDYFASLNKYDAQVPVLACEGYVFEGWALVLEGAVTNRLLFDAQGHGQGTYGLEDDALCVPKWTARTWQVTWDYAMPATADTIDPGKTTETYNATFEGVEDPACDGYVFEGWKRGSETIGPNEVGQTVFRPTGDALDASVIAYTASWSAIEYEVVLFPGDHATYEDMDSKYVQSNDTYVYPYTVEDGKWSLVSPDDDQGYATVYWEHRQDDGSWVRYDLSYVSPKDFQGTSGTLTFRAVQKAVTATIALTPGADKPEEALDDVPWPGKKHSYSLEESVTLPESLTYPGWTFVGWRLVKEGDKTIENAPVLAPGALIEAPANQNPLSRTYEAVWEKDVYRIVFLRSEQNPYEVAESIQNVKYEDEFIVPHANFRDAFTGGTTEGDILKDSNGRILKHYEVTEGKGAYLQGQKLSVKDILEAYPDKTDAKGNAPHNGSTIALYGSWTTSYDVDVPLRVTVSFDPERPSESMLFGEGHLRLTKDIDTPLVDVVGLICEPVAAASDGPGTEAVFDSDTDVLSGTYLTLAPKVENATPVEFNLGSVTRAGTSGFPLTGISDGVSQKRLSDLGFTFGGATDAARTLDLAFGLRFDSSVDTKRFDHLKSSGVLNANEQVPIARIYYTLALRSATVPASIA